MSEKKSYDLCVVCGYSQKREVLGKHTFECANKRHIEPQTLEQMVHKHIKKRPLSFYACSEGNKFCSTLRDACGSTMLLPVTKSNQSQSNSSQSQTYSSQSQAQSKAIKIAASAFDFDEEGDEEDGDGEENDAEDDDGEHEDDDYNDGEHEDDDDNEEDNEGVVVRKLNRSSPVWEHFQQKAGAGMCFVRN
jgi:hypothetical protein